MRDPLTNLVRKLGRSKARAGLMVAFAMSCAGSDGAAPYEEPVGAASQAITCLTIDDSALGTSFVHDAAIAQNPLDPSVANTRFGASPHLSAGEVQTTQSRSLLSFDLLAGGVPPEAVVTSADLHLFILQTPGGQPFRVSTATAAWSESTVTWNAFAGSPNGGLGATHATVATAGLAGTTVTVPLLASEVQTFLDPASNNGLLIDHPSPGRTTLASNEASAGVRPSLSVCYQTPTCSDGIQNQDESGVDCGGATCGACDCSSGGPGCGEHHCSALFGGSLDDYVFSVAVDSADNAVFIAHFSGSDAHFGGAALPNAGGTDLVVAKVSPDCQPIWSKSFGSVADDRAADIAVDSADNIFIAGEASGPIDFGTGVLPIAGYSDVVVAKLDPNGNTVWSQVFGGTQYDHAFKISVAPNDDIVFSGDFRSPTLPIGGTTLVHAGLTDGFLARLSNDGIAVWARGIGGTSTDGPPALAVDASDNTVITGKVSIFATVDLGGGPLPPGTGSYVAKYDSAGAYLWSVNYGSSAALTPTAVAVSNSGTITVTGWFSNTIDLGNGPMTSYGITDIYLASYSSAGALLWAEHFGSASNDLPSHVAVRANGEIVLTGWVSSPAGVNLGGGTLPNTATMADAFLANYTPGGALVWAKLFKSAGFDQGAGIAIGSTGRTVTVGGSSGSLNLGGGFLLGLGGRDAYLGVYEP